MQPSDYTAQQRAALVMFWICGGLRLTTEQLAERLGVTPNGAWRIVYDINTVIGLEKDAEGQWVLRDNCLEME